MRCDDLQAAGGIAERQNRDDRRCKASGRIDTNGLRMRLSLPLGHRLAIVFGLSLPAMLALAPLPVAEAARHARSGPGAPPGPALFGTDEVYSPDLSPFVKWTGMLARFRAEQQRAARRCAPGIAAGCEPEEWRRLVDEVGGLELRAKLERVNAAINRHPYVSSLSNWGERNHWETPFEFFRKSGQCQDYAIAKYLVLRAAGVPAEQLRVVVLRDMRRGLDHAVAVAYVAGEVLVLDNQSRDIARADDIRHYQPYYSINEQGWWLHVGPRARYAAASEAGLE